MKNVPSVHAYVCVCIYMGVVCVCVECVCVYMHVSPKEYTATARVVFLLHFIIPTSAQFVVLHNTNVIYFTH